MVLQWPCIPISQPRPRCDAAHKVFGDDKTGKKAESVHIMSQGTFIVWEIQCPSGGCRLGQPVSLGLGERTGFAGVQVGVTGGSACTLAPSLTAGSPPLARRGCRPEGQLPPGSSALRVRFRELGRAPAPGRTTCPEPPARLRDSGCPSRLPPLRGAWGGPPASVARSVQEPEGAFEGRADRPLSSPRPPALEWGCGLRLRRPRRGGVREAPPPARPRPGVRIRPAGGGRCWRFASRGGCSCAALPGARSGSCPARASPAPRGARHLLLTPTGAAGAGPGPGLPPEGRGRARGRGGRGPSGAALEGFADRGVACGSG